MLALRDVTVAGYRSLRRITFPVERLSVFAGGNGTGKTNLYRALELLRAAALGRLTRDLSAEGGMESALWAGERRRTEPARIRLVADLADDETGQAYRYEVEVGQVGCDAMGRPRGAAFPLEPQIKVERLSLTSGRHPIVMLGRDGPAGFVRDENGR